MAHRITQRENDSKYDRPGPADVFGADQRAMVLSDQADDIQPEPEVWPVATVAATNRHHRIEQLQRRRFR